MVRLQANLSRSREKFTTENGEIQLQTQGDCDKVQVTSKNNITVIYQARPALSGFLLLVVRVARSYHTS